jgi:uncharacterized protein
MKQSKIFIAPLFILTAIVSLAKPVSLHAKDADVKTKKVLIVTGNDYPGHKWKLTTPVLQNAISRDPRLLVTVTEKPSSLASPDLFDYDVIVLHFMDWETPDPGPKARSNLQKFVADGKGLVLVHFACGAFQDWPEFRSLAGRGWDPKLRGHDPHGQFRVDIIKPDHPIMQGLESFDTIDELYTCLAGDRPIELLATSKSKVDGKDYPMAFVHIYGRGRVFHCPLGHDVRAFAAPNVQALFRRGAAWCAQLPLRSYAAPSKKIVLIAGPASQDKDSHNWPGVARLLKKCLDSASNVKGIRTEVVLNGWPKDAAVLADADAIVLLSDGLQAHPWAKPQRLKKIRQLAKKGVGLAFIHYAVTPPKGAEVDFLEWIGGYREIGYSQNPITTVEVSPASKKHPICRGWKPFTASDEFYYQIRFRKNDKRLTPVLTALLPKEQPKKEILAWTVERKDGGRGFGFTGGHYNANWQIEPFRKMVLQAILWTAKVEIPKGGIKSKIKEK